MAHMSKKRIPRKSHARGFTLIELLLVVAFALIMSALAIPKVSATIASYQLDGAADTLSGAVQGARYQAIMHGYPYQVDIDSTTNQCTILSEAPPAATFTAVANAVPITSIPAVIGVGTANPSQTGHLILQFKANGSILVASGQPGAIQFTIAYDGTTKHFTVSNYGSISIITTQP
jgi:type IV fimbrial biogenesis protein FimT